MTTPDSALVGDAETTTPVRSFDSYRLNIPVWQNEGEHGPFFTVSLSRSYQDGEEWKETPRASLRPQDLLGVAEQLRGLWHLVNRNRGKYEEQTLAVDDTDTKKPVASLKAGSCDVALWGNVSSVDGGVFFTATVCRNYLEDPDDDASWTKTPTASLRESDLLPACERLAQAWNYVDTQQRRIARQARDAAA